MNNLGFDFYPEQQFEPLAARMRPRTLSEYVGQSHILAEGKPLREALLRGAAHSMILWGPPGTGKTTLAELVARTADAEVVRLSAVTSGIKEIRAAVATAEQNRQLHGRRTVLFVDEVHRFNKSQQDAFLPHIESGVFTFIGATTENPSFELNNALLSRARVYLLKSFTAVEMQCLIEQALSDDERGLGGRGLRLAPAAMAALIDASAGDGRRALNLLEITADLVADESEIGRDTVVEACGASAARFDKQGDQFYDMLSAVHKSIRGSSADGALYWYARMLTAGCDPLVVARRLLAIASEDIGNADPKAMSIAINAWDCFTRVGPAEGERAIAQAIVYLAVAPKSNAVYTAFKAAVSLAQQTHDQEVPLHLRNAPTKLMKEMGHGAEYRYAHDEPHAYAAGECYLPPALSDQVLYRPTERGLEAKIREKLDWLEQLNRQSPKRRYE